MIDAGAEQAVISSVHVQRGLVVSQDELNALVGDFEKTAIAQPQTVATRVIATTSLSDNRKRALALAAEHSTVKPMIAKIDKGLSLPTPIPKHALDISPSSPTPGDYDCVSPYDFPSWFFAEVELGGMTRVVSILHVQTPTGPIPYWFEDAENQHRGLPLYKVMNPHLLGDYGTILENPLNMAIFVGLCHHLHDLPDPLTCVQVIQWVNHHEKLAPTLPSSSPVLIRAIAQAASSLELMLQARREEFRMVMLFITGKSAMNHFAKR